MEKRGRRPKQKTLLWFIWCLCFRYHLSFVKADLMESIYCFKRHARFTKKCQKSTETRAAICSIIITSKEYIGDPIHCIVNQAIDQKAINTYCWIGSTFTVTAHQNDYFHHPVPYLGVGNEHYGNEITHQKYYQWVCFILAIQAAMFFLPHCLWKVWEGGRIKMLVADLCTPVADKWTPEKKQQIIEFFSKSGFYNLNLYALQFLFCEFLNVLNIILQIFIWNQVFYQKFISFGIDVIEFASSDGLKPKDPISALFPKIAKCNFHYYGPSGSFQHIDAVCVLPLNMINEKMFIFLWFWFFSLALLTVSAFLFDIFLFHRQFLRIYILQAQARSVSRAKIRTIVTHRSLGHWFLLHQLGRNMNPFVFCDLLTDLAKALDESKLTLKEQTDV